MQIYEQAPTARGSSKNSGNNDQLYRYAQDLQSLSAAHQNLVQRSCVLGDLSRLTCEATTGEHSHRNLHRTLVFVRKLLRGLPGIRVTARSAICLLNPRGELVQVAELGLPAIWAGEPGTRQAGCRTPDSSGQAYVSTQAQHLPWLKVEGGNAQARLIVLPLRGEHQPLGEAVLYIDDQWQPCAPDLSFMSDLARVLSDRVASFLAGEMLAVREVELVNSRSEVIHALCAASELRDSGTGSHMLRMTQYAIAIAKAAGLDPETLEILTICAPMHDVGKIGISDAVMRKSGKLSKEEFDVMKTHTVIGERLLDGDDRMMRAAREIAASHHERWDGGGYPSGKAGEEIFLLARICSIADVFDALTSERPCKQPWTFNEAVAMIQEQSGAQFDPALVAAFSLALPQILRIQELYCDKVIDPRKMLALPEACRPESGWIEWSEDLRIGIDVIDEHHRYLIDIINDLFDVVTGNFGSAKVARILGALTQYASIHFRAEEQMMVHYGFSQLESQKHQHYHFEQKLQQFHADLRSNPLTTQFEVLLYLRDWLVQHILREDTQLKVLVAASSAA